MIVMQLQTKYNTETPVVFNTIQCYLKDARPRLQIELEAHRRLGVKSGFKLVRGAYILQERQRSKEMEYPDPTCDDIAMTHANYDTCVLDAIRQVPTGAAVMVASHNQKSIETAVNAIARMGLGPNDGVYFGQLLGMGDHLTTAIAAHGCRPYKYVPYGPIDKCVAYLTRRVQENSTLLAGEPIIAERRMLRGELFKRLTFRS
jgi:proline dehydrogenase